MAKFDQKVEDYVANLFGVSSKTTKVEDLPEGYDPLDEMAEDDNDFSLVKIFSKALDPQTGMPRDIKIPEGDFPEAKNYYDFCENFLGPDVRFPFTRQMWIAIHALGEYCPRCSHPRWANVLTTPLHSDPKNLPDRVQFLHYGKCPKCKVTKRELIEKKELNLYTEMALCVSGSSRIQTTDGYLRIQDVSPTGRVYSGRTMKKYRNWVNNGVQTTWRTTTRTGHFTDTTASHKHLVVDDTGFKWVEQRNLEIGQHLVLSGGHKNPVTSYFELDLPDVDTNYSRTGTAKKPTHLTEDFAYLLGLWESDGHYRVGDATLGNTNLKILAKASSCIKSVFGLDVSYSLKVGSRAGSRVHGDYTRNKDCYVLALRNTQASTWLQTVGSGQKSKYNKIPEGIWSSPDSVILAYLAGALDGDGAQRKDSTDRGFTFTTTSLENAEGLHLLLTRLGIISFLRPGYGVAVLGQYADRVLDMLSPYQVRPLQTKPDSKVQQSGAFGIPADSIWKLIDSKVARVNRRTSVYYLKDGTQFSTADWTGFRNITLLSSRTKFLCPLKAKEGYYDCLLDLVETLCPSLGRSLKVMRDKRLFSSPIQSKVRKGREEVFDIEVKQHHSFVCNGVVVHNCIGQRAGKSTITASMSAYLLHKYLKYPKLSNVCEGIQASTPLTATFLGLRFADAYGLLWEPLVKNIKQSTWFCIAEGTPVTLADGSSLPIEQLSAGLEVKTLEGQSTIEHVFDNGHQECLTVTLATGQELTGTAEHQVRCVVDGALIWKKIGDLLPDDLAVVKSAESYSKVVSSKPVGVKHVYDIEVRGVHNYYASGVNVHNCEFDSMLDDYGKRLGIEFYRHKDLYIKYMHKNLELYPSGPNKRALRGRTRWLSATDELGWWPLYPDDGKDRERADGEEVYKAIDRSLLTMRREMRTLFKKGYSNFVMPFNINVSSPADQADMITKLVEKNAESTRCLALRLPTWEVSPLFGRDNEEIVQAYKDDPVAAERDYGAMPPLNSSMWLVLKEAERPFIGKQHATVELVRTLKDEEWKRYGKVLTQSVPQPCPATLMAIDAGYSNNSFAFVILALNKIKVGDVYDTKIECLCAGEIQPARGEKLHYTRIYLNVLKPLMRAFNTRYFFADRWNSIALLDRAADEFADVQLVAKQFSVKYVDFVTTRSYVREGRLILPKIEMDVADVMKVDEYPKYFADKPAAHLLFQMLTVKDKGSSVVKGNNYTDDILRALVLGVSRILDPKIMEKMLQLSAVVTRSKLVGAVAVGRSAGMLNILGAKSGAQKATAMLGYSHNTPELSTGEQTQVAAKSHVVRINRSG